MDTNEKILAWICVTSVRNPWNSKINKSFYSLVLRKDDNDMGVYVRTRCSTDVREQKVHCRDGGEAQLSNILHTKFGRTEVARAISRLSQCGWVEKQETRQLILDDMRFIEAPFDVTYVELHSIVPGHIKDIVCDVKEETHIYTISPKGEPNTVVCKYQGEINIPYNTWRKE